MKKKEKYTIELVENCGNTMNVKITFPSGSVIGVSNMVKDSFKIDFDKNIERCNRLELILTKEEE